jgi:hypothetical protein
MRREISDHGTFQQAEMSSGVPAGLILLIE